MIDIPKAYSLLTEKSILANERTVTISCTILDKKITDELLLIRWLLNYFNLSLAYKYLVQVIIDDYDYQKIQDRSLVKIEDIDSSHIILQQQSWIEVRAEDFDGYKTGDVVNWLLLPFTASDQFHFGFPPVVTVLKKE